MEANKIAVKSAKVNVSKSGFISDVTNGLSKSELKTKYDISDTVSLHCFA